MSFIRSFLLTLNPPFRESISSRDGFISPAWTSYFSILTQLVSPLGSERSFTITNNQAVAADIEGMSFSAKTVSQAVVDFYIQRVTDSNEEITSGTFHATYLPASVDWALTMMGTPGPDAIGLTFSITDSGQVQYTSTNVTGTITISKITWRARTLAAKNSQYSVMGGS